MTADLSQLPLDALLRETEEAVAWMARFSESAMSNARTLHYDFRGRSVPLLPELARRLRAGDEQLQTATAALIGERHNADAHMRRWMAAEEQLQSVARRLREMETENKELQDNIANAAVVKVRGIARSDFSIEEPPRG